MYHYTYIANQSPTATRASAYFRSENSAISRLDSQNAKAEEMGLRTRYARTTCEETGIDVKEVRD